MTKTMTAICPFCTGEAKGCAINPGTGDIFCDRCQTHFDAAAVRQRLDALNTSWNALLAWLARVPVMDVPVAQEVTHGHTVELMDLWTVRVLVHSGNRNWHLYMSNVLDNMGVTAPIHSVHYDPFTGTCEVILLGCPVKGGVGIMDWMSGHSMVHSITSPGGHSYVRGMVA